MYGCQVVTLPLIVVAVNGPTLFGREWLSTIKLDRNKIDSVQNDALDSLLQKYKSIFYRRVRQIENFSSTFMSTHKVLYTQMVDN